MKLAGRVSRRIRAMLRPAGGLLGGSVRFPTMTEIDAELRDPLTRHRRRRTLVVIAESGHGVKRLELERSLWARSRIVTIVEISAAGVHDQLAALSAVDLVVDARSSSSAQQLEAFEQNFWHVDPHGAWVTLRTTRPLPWREPMVRLGREIQAARSGRGVRPEWRPHARSVSNVKVTRSLVVLTKRKQQHRLGVREAEASVVLRSREPRLRITEIRHLATGTLDATGLVHDHGAIPRLQVPEKLVYPEHSVWQYDGVVSLPRGPIAYHRRTLLPDSFRWPMAPELHIQLVQRFGEAFFQVKELKSAARLRGSYYNLLYSHPGHFGHLMTEALARLWGWWPAKEMDPSLKILCRRQPSRAAPGLEAILLPAFGISPEDIVWVDGGVKVEHLVGCTPMWHNTPPFYAHPEIRETWSRLRRALIGGDHVETAPRIFLTRRGGNRPCRNVKKVERFFTDRGYVVIAPEKLSVPDQVATLANARVVAGFGGAGMFNLIYAPTVETVIVLNQTEYQARNEHLIAAVHGVPIHSFWSPLERGNAPNARSYRAHQGAWSFDFELNGEQLARLLERGDA